MRGLYVGHQYGRRKGHPFRRPYWCLYVAPAARLRSTPLSFPLLLHDANHPTTEEPVDAKDMCVDNGEPCSLTEGTRLDKGVGMKKACTNTASQPRQDPPGKGRQMPDKIFQEQLPSGHEEAMEGSERGDGIWQSMQGVGARDEIKALNW